MPEKFVQEKAMSEASEMNRRAFLGKSAAVIAGGVGAIIITLIWSRLFPELRRARTFDPPEARAAEAVSN